MQKFKCILSALLVLVMVFSMIPAQVFAEKTEPTSEVDTGDVTIEGTNGFGTLLSQEVQESQEESASAEGDYETGYSVVGLIFEGATATVEYCSLEDAILVVALYTEDGMKMLTSGKTTVTADATEATVTIEGTMPEYFLASAYLVDTYDLSPLCEAYDTPMYTQEMQELLASTVDDYAPDRVLNLDEDETTNFAVYAETTTIIEYVEGVNTVASVDDETATYVIENADEQFTTLSVGDVVAYSYGDTEILIAKIGAITVDGSTVTITGIDLEMEEVFSHVKVETNSVSGDMSVIEGTGEEGITYVGLTEDSGGVTPYAVEGGATVNLKHKFEISKVFTEDHYGGDEGGEVPNTITVAGTLEFGVEFEFNYYASWTRRYVKFVAEAGVDVNIGITGKLNNRVCKLPSFGASPIIGVYIGIKPQFELQASAELTWEASYSFKLGFSYSNDKGGENLTTPPKFESEIKLEGTLFFGIDLHPTIEVIGGTVVDVDLTGLVGFEINGKLAGSQIEQDEDDVVHSCELCIQGDIQFKAAGSVKIAFLKCKDLTVDLDIFEAKFKICDYYVSLTHGTYGLKTCPYTNYELIFEVRNGIDLLMSDTEILKKDGTSLGKTNDRGVLIAWLPLGKTTVKATVLGEELQKTIEITEDDAGSKVVLKFGVLVSAKDYLTGADDCIDQITYIASGKCGSNVYWTLSDDGILSIAGKGSMQNYAASDSPWYSYCNNIGSVIIGNGVTTIGRNAFTDCTGLTTVKIPDSVATIDEYAFLNCTGLTSVEIPDSVTTIGEAAFSNCTDLTTVKIPDSVTAIGQLAFSNCTSLTAVEIPDSISTIAHGTFRYCTNLTSVTISDGVTVIGQSAFGDCTSLTSVTIPDSVTTIAYGTFWGCSGLTSVMIPGSVTTIGEYAFADCGSLNSAKFPDSVTSIGAYAFADCTGLTSVEIPESVTTIAYATFYGCTSLTSVMIPNSVTTIDGYAFGDCDSLAGIKLPDSVTTIAKYAFGYCDSLTSIEIPDSVTTIGGNAFAESYNLEEIVFCGNAPSIESTIFGYITATAYYPAGNTTWTSDTMNAFGGYITWIPYTLDGNGNMILNEAVAVVETEETTELTDALVLETAEESAQTRLDLSTEDIEEQGETLAPYAVYDGEYSTVVTDTYTLKTASFSGLVPDQQYILLAMVSIDVEDLLAADNLLYIDQAAALEDGTLVFQYVQRTATDTSYVVACGASNKDLNDAEITFPEMITDGEVQAVNPTVVYDGKTLTEGQDYTIQGTVSFTEAGTYTCYIRGVRNYAGLVECTYTVVNPYYEVASGTCGDNLTWTFYDNGRLTISGTGSMTEFSDSSLVPWDDRRSSIVTVIIDQGVTTISDFAFTECSGLTSAAIGDSVTTIGDYAFDSCTSLMSVAIPDSMTTIGSYVFRDCTNLTRVTIGDSVTNIANGAFYNCDSLTSVTMGSGVTRISAEAFRSCNSLNNIAIGDGVTNIGYAAFQSCTSLTNVTIPDSVTTIGDAAFNSCTSLTSVTIPDSVTTIGNGVFRSCTSLTSVEIPEGVTTIGDYAFASCTNLPNVEIPDSVTTISSSAFYYCASLTSVTIPGSVTTIGSYAFKACSSLTGIHVDQYNPNYSSDDRGVLFDREKTELIQAPGAISGFYGIPDSVTAIGPHAFSSCTGLRQIAFMGDAPAIDAEAFSFITVNAYYSADNPTWTENVFQNYGGTITWVAGIPGCTDHSYEAVVTEPTCTEKGYTTYTCPTCGDYYIADEMEALGHAYKSVATGNNELVYTCTTCGYSYTKEILEDILYGFYSDGAWIKGYTGNARRLILPAAIDGRSVSRIGDEAFLGCSTLVSITIQGYVTYIGDSAFEDCTSLADITIPFYVTTIGAGAFRNCTSLRYICFEGDAPAFGEDVFSDVIATAYYPADNDTWTTEVLQNYGGEITWLPDTERLDYYVYDDYVEIQSYEGEATEVVIPAEIEGLPVTTISWRAFWNCSSLLGITIPDSVTTIGEEAFGNCFNLTSVTIPDSVTSIGNGAFAYCSNLTSIYFDGNAPVFGENVFSGVYATAYFPDNTTWTDEVMLDYGGSIIWKTLDSLLIPLGLDYWVYEDHVEITDCHSSLTEVVIPAKIDRLPVTIICDEAFRSCSNLTSVTIPDSVTYIGDSAFKGCSSLTTINIPDSVTYIGEFAFAYCENLVSSITIPDGITHIGDYAFYDCISMPGSITIPVSLTSMGTGAFAQCDSLISITIQDGVTSVVEQTFSGCNSVTSITIPDSVVSIGERAFEHCDGVTSINIPASVTFIGYEAFYYCSKLTSIRFNGDAPEFGEDVFLSVYGTAYYPGDNPTWTTELMENCNSNSINWVAEGEVFGMEIVSTPEYGIVGLTPDLSELCVELIYGNDIHRPVENSKLTISEIDTTTAGKKNAIVSYDDFSAEFAYGVHEVTGVVLDSSLYPESEHDYGNSMNETQTLTWPGADCLELVFSDATFVENNFDQIYVYDENDGLIVSYTGAGAAGVTLVVRGDTVKIRLTSDTSGTDYGYSFTTITAKSASHTGTVIIPTVEATCIESGRTEGFVCEICDQEQYTVIPALGHDYAIAVTAPTCETAGYTTYTCAVCADSYTADETEALGHSHDAVVTDPTCTEKGYTTYMCSNCGDSYVDSYVDALDHGYVEGVCTRCGAKDPDWIASEGGTCGENLTWTLTDGVLRISGQGPMSNYSVGGTPWYSKRSLITALVIENGVTTIGDLAFRECDSLVNVEIPSSVISLGEYAFSDCVSLCSVEIPDSVSVIDQYAFFSCTSLSSVTIPEGVTAICDSVFRNCTGLGSLMIPDSVVSIGKYAFMDCTNLSSITIPDNVTTIGDFAFSTCSSLSSITIGNSVTTIGNNAFRNCDSLVSVTIPDSVTYIDVCAFLYCDNLAEICVGTNNPNYSSDSSGILYDKQKTTVVRVPGAMSGDYEISHGVSTIGNAAFMGCKGLNSVTVPASVTAIEDYALSYCSSLHSITFRGNAPTFAPCTFLDITATAYYPAEDMTWTAERMQDYRGTITWEQYTRSCKEHSYQALVTEPTCIEQGCTTYTCVNCGDSYTEEIAATGHGYTGVTTAPTCTTAGYTTYTCSNCGDSYTDDTVAATGHNYVDGTCSSCGAKDSNEGEEDIVAPTVTAKSFTLSFEDEILANFYYTVSDLTSVTEHGMLVFYSDPGTVDIANAVAVYNAPVYDSAKDRYMATTTGIAAKEMGDTRYYCAYAKLSDGSYVYSKIYDYSPKKYAMNMLGKTTTSNKQKALCVAMLNYGAAAQNYFGYNTDRLMNAELTAEQQALVIAYDASLFTGAVAADTSKIGAFAATSPGFSKKSATVSFEGAFCVNYYFTPNLTVDGAVIFYYWTADAYANAKTLAPSNASGKITMVNQGNGTYWAQVDGIAAKSLDETYYVAAMYYSDMELCCTGVIAYSLSKYCMNNANGNMGELAQATAMYGYYAKNYFA